MTFLRIPSFPVASSGVFTLLVENIVFRISVHAELKRISRVVSSFQANVLAMLAPALNGK